MAWRFALLLVIATRAFPCSCSGNWPSVKQAWEKAPFVFLGTVEMADPDEDSSQTIFQAQSVRIRVDEAFKGVSRGKTIELHQGGTDCDAKFRTGQRAVFYLWAGATPGSWGVPFCTRALGSAESGGDDLLFLRGLPRSASGTRLSGAINLYEDSPIEAFRRVGGIPDVRVKVMGPRGLARELVTNAAGVYEVFGLRPGRYSVNFEVPKGLKIKFPMVTGSPGITGDDAAVELAPNGGATVDFVLQADTRLSGRMLDAQGAPMTGVCVDLEPLEGRGENGARFFDCSKEGGGFTMEMMPPGKYLLVVHDDVHWDLLESTSTLYYPGLRDRQLAAVVSIAAGAYVENIEVRLPRDERRYKIAGKLRFIDGAPVADASVTFTSPEHGYSEATRTGPDGSFGLPVIAGMEGQLSGQLGVFEPILRLCPELRVGSRRRGMILSIDGEPVTLSADSDHEGLELKLSSPSCKSLPAGRR
jgi:hypothetical protein